MKTKYTLTIDEEIRELIVEALELERELNAMEVTNPRYGKENVYLHYLRLEIGKQIAWMFEHVPF